jgi:hypothetical protein
MTTGEKTSGAVSKRGTKPVSASSRHVRHDGSSGAPRRSDKDAAIATELAPAVAIALLNQTEHTKGEPAAALEPLAAGAVSSEVDGKLRVQLLFENGAVLPIEMSDDAAAALGKGIAKELKKSQ